MNLPPRSPKVALACSAKLHAFNLASELDQYDMLNCFFTGYATQKAPVLSKIFKRVDKEQIAKHKINVNWWVGAGLKFDNPNAFKYNDRFDRWVARKLRQCPQSNIFVGWSGMSLHALRQAKVQNMVTILERGSAHIVYQDLILREEHAQYGLPFEIDKRVIAKELEEYDAADYIVVPSTFARRTFIEAGVSASKLVQMPLGVPTFFNQDKPLLHKTPQTDGKFRIVFLGSLIVRKGLIYLFEAIKQLNIPKDKFELWLLGHISPEIEPVLNQYKQENWIIKGHVGFHELPLLLQQCDIGVFPSIEDGFAMVIPQMLACGVPVITTPHTGGPDLIREGDNGFIIPIRNSEAIAQKLEWLYAHRDVCTAMGENAAANAEDLSWAAYGKKYRAFLDTVL